MKNRKFTINKNCHYPRPFTFLSFLKNIKLCMTRSINMSFKFWSSCRYELNDKDYNDINKLCGFSLGYHHNNSFRIGWKYNKSNNNIDLYLYVWEDYDLRQPIFLRSVGFFEKCNITLNVAIENQCYVCRLLIDGKESIIPLYYPNIEIKKYVSYPLGIYFGGNNKAPKDMTIELECDY